MTKLVWSLPCHSARKEAAIALSGIAWLGFAVALSHARLSWANLHEARLNHAICRNTHFDNARMVLDPR